MKQGSFEKEIFIRSEAQTVIAVIADYSNHHRIHPLSITVERAKEKPAGVLFGYAFKQAEIAHTEMLKRIKKFVEATK
jgi:hypothetical protein